METNSKYLNMKLKTLFTVKVPRRATYSPEELELVGMVQKYDMYGNPVTKKSFSDTEEDLCVCMLPLKRLVELYCTGTYISLVEPKDSVRVYEILDDYVDYFKNLGSYTIHNIDNSDNYILEQVEKFLDEVYEYNTKRIDKATLGNPNAFTFGFNVDSSFIKPEKADIDKSYLYNNQPTPNLGRKQNWRDQDE